MQLIAQNDECRCDVASGWTQSGTHSSGASSEMPRRVRIRHSITAVVSVSNVRSGIPLCTVPRCDFELLLCHVLTHRLVFSIRLVVLGHGYGLSRSLHHCTRVPWDNTSEWVARPSVLGLGCTVLPLLPPHTYGRRVTDAQGPEVCEPLFTSGSNPMSPSQVVHAAVLLGWWPPSLMWGHCAS